MGQWQHMFKSNIQNITLCNGKVGGDAFWPVKTPSRIPYLLVTNLFLSLISLFLGSANWWADQLTTIFCLSLIIRVTWHPPSSLAPHPLSLEGSLCSHFLFYFMVSSWAMCLQQISCKIKQAFPPFFSFLFFQGVAGEKVVRENYAQ